MKTAIDWSTRPEPWRSFGKKWAAEVRKIAGKPRPVRRDQLPDQNGAALTGRRLKLKLTVAELARLSGVSDSHISQIEHGGKTGGGETWERLEAVLAKLEAERDGR